MASLAIAAAGITLVPGVASAAGLASGVLDPDFNPGANGQVDNFAVQPDGKVLMVGWFTQVQGAAGAVTRKYLARFHPDGRLDESFNADITGSGSPGVSAVAIEPDGDIIIGGKFTKVNGTTTRTNLARLAPDGTADPTFTGSVDGVVNTLLIQPDGRIIVGGTFGSVTGTAGSSVARTNIARFESDGRVDTGFNAQMTMSENETPSVATLSLLPSGKIMVGGTLTCFGPAGDGITCQGVTRHAVARLNGGDGSVDTSFGDTKIAGHAETVTGLAVLPDGKMIVAGQWPTIDGRAWPDYARLNSDGTLDTTFTNHALGGQYDYMQSVSVQADGKVLLGGQFSTIGGAPRENLVRLDGSGAIDPFVVDITDGQWFNYVMAPFLQPDGRLLIGGWFGKVNGTVRNYAARIGTGSGPAVGPSAVTATAGNAGATVSWTALPGEITSYTVTSSPGGKTCTVDVKTTTCTVTGLTNGTEYTFTVAAANEFGTGAASWASNPVTPSAPVSPVVPGPSGGGSSNAVIPQVVVPAAIAKTGIPVAVNGTVRLPLVCPAGIPGNCDASGVLSMTLPRAVQAERGAAQHAKSRVRTLATFKGVQIASGSTRLYSVRLVPKTYNALRKAGIRRVPADLRTTNRLAGGDPINSQQRIWLKILPLKKVPKVVPVTG